MTGYVTDQIGGTGSYIEMYWNSDVVAGDFQAGGNFWTWYRSLNTQEWLGPFPITGPVYKNRDRYTRWFVDTSTIPDFNLQHRDGFYQFVVTPPFGPTDKPTLGVQEQGMIKLIFDNGGSINTKNYISNNEQREADTYFRPNYTP